MNSQLSRRDFLKVGGLAASSLAFPPFLPNLTDFDDSNVIRIATKEMPVYRQPTDKEGPPVARWLRDDLVHIYQEVRAKDGEPRHNPIWYRVWGGYMHRGRVQRVRTIYQQPLSFIPEASRRLAEVSTPWTEPYRYTKTYGWQPLGYRLYYQSVHWLEAVEEGPQDTGYDGPWYRIYDELIGYPYHVPAMHLRPLPLDVFDPITPDIPWEEKLIEVNLSTQTLAAYEYGKVVFQTSVSTGIPGGGESGVGGLSTTTPSSPKGKFFEIMEKVPSKHMGNGNLFGDVDDYELPGVPWTSFFTAVGHAFHGTYWHENFGTPMSHGCVNMRTNDANWIFRWARPPHTTDAISNHSARGTMVEIHY